jgi:hypothetical protein
MDQIELLELASTRNHSSEGIGKGTCECDAVRSRRRDRRIENAQRTERGPTKRSRWTKTISPNCFEGNLHGEGARGCSIVDSQQPGGSAGDARMEVGRADRSRESSARIRLRLPFAREKNRTQIRQAQDLLSSKVRARARLLTLRAVKLIDSLAFNQSPIGAF